MKKTANLRQEYIRGIEAQVVVTGLGALAPNGSDLKSFWDGLINGRSGIGFISRFDATDHRAKIAGEVKDFDLSQLSIQKKRAQTIRLRTTASMRRLRPLQIPAL